VDTYVDELDCNGFVVVPNVLDDCAVEQIITLMARTGTQHGKRNVLDLDELQAIVQDKRVRSLVERVVGANAVAVRGLFFDKTPAANWMVDWHQDRTIAVREQLPATGFNLWTLKAGVPHVQPPVTVLEQMLTLRLHLDDANESNGALRVIPASHRAGFIPEKEIKDWVRESAPITSAVSRGGVLMMRPLILHASSKARRTSHRRVLHLEFAAQQLPNGLKWAFSV